MSRVTNNKPLKIGIDARFLGPMGTGIGRYTQKLIENLEKITPASSPAGETPPRNTSPRKHLRGVPQVRPHLGGGGIGEVGELAGVKVNEYVIFLRKENFNLYEPANPNFRKVLADIPWYSVREQIALPAIFGREKLDLLHVPHFNVPLFYRGKFVVTIHDLIKSEWGGGEATTKGPLEYRVKRVGYGVVVRYAVRRARAIFVPSNYVRDKVVKLFRVDPQRITVTYEAGTLLGKERTEEEKEVEDVLGRFGVTKPYFLYVGNVYPYKNLSRLVEAVVRLNTRIRFTRYARNTRIKMNSNNSNSGEYKNLDFVRNLVPRFARNKKGSGVVSLVVVGARDVFKERLEKEIVKKGALKYVTLTGYVTDPDLIDLYREAEAYVQPSLSEGFGLTSVEAMSLGTPVVESSASCLPEIAGDAALYFNPLDPSDIASKLQQILEDSKLRNQLSSRGLKKAKSFSWERMARQTLSVYEDAVNGEW